MLRLFVLGGPFMWILLLITGAVVSLSVRDAIALSTPAGFRRVESRNGSGAILFWGCIAAVLGILASLIALYLSLSAIRAASAVNPNLEAEGLAVALITTIFGFVILAYAATAWFVLRFWMRKIASRAAGQAGALA